MWRYEDRIIVGRQTIDANAIPQMSICEDVGTVGDG